MRGSPATESLREVVQVNARGERILPICSEDAGSARTIAHWPVLAEPWLSQAQQAASRAPAFAASCRDSEVVNTRHLRIDGLIHGAVLRRAPGASDPPGVRMRALGAQGDVLWLINGTLTATRTASEPFEHRFETPGRFRILALDARGAFDAVEVRVLTE